MAYVAGLPQGANPRRHAPCRAGGDPDSVLEGVDANVHTDVDVDEGAAPEPRRP